MQEYTKEDILRIVEEEDVEFIRLQFTDIFGTMKNMAVTVSQLEKAMDNRCMFDVSSLEGLDHTQAVKDICLSTVLCIVTIPVVVTAAGVIL